jgi:hypothetical protein
MATTTSSGKGAKIGAVGDLKGHKNASISSNDGSCEKMLAPDGGQKVETASPETSRNPGKTKVDSAFEDLSPTAHKFLQAQGITSALNLMATNASGLAPAWVEWNKGAFKTNRAKSDLRDWKHKVRDRWYSSSTKEDAAPQLASVLRLRESDVSEFLIAQGIASEVAFLLSRTETMANALVEWIGRTKNKQLGFVGARRLINIWKRKAREQTTSIWGQPLVELDAEFQTLSSMAIRFLSSQGIATAEAFLSMNVNATANVLMDWRKQGGSSECTIAAARSCIYNWKIALREHRQSSRQEASRELAPELDVLSSILSDWQNTLQERITGTGTMQDAISRSITPSVVSASPNDSRSSLLP